MRRLYLQPRRPKAFVAIQVGWLTAVSPVTMGPRRPRSGVRECRSARGPVWPGDRVPAVASRARPGRRPQRGLNASRPQGSASLVVGIIRVSSIRQLLWWAVRERMSESRSREPEVSRAREGHCRDDAFCHCPVVAHGPLVSCHTPFTPALVRAPSESVPSAHRPLNLNLKPDLRGWLTGRHCPT